MQRLDAPELDRIILRHLADRYTLTRKREGIHLSTLVYCLTRSYLDAHSEDIMPTDEELMLFALGLGLQNELTPQSATTPVYQTAEGIIYSPDMTFEVESFRVELKTTRSGVKRYDEGELPETWIEYIMGGCKILGIKEYYLTRFHVSERPVPKLKSEVLKFDDNELDDNWYKLLDRKYIYERAFEKNTPPTPFKYSKQWECKGCRYYTICTALSITGG